MDFTGAVDTDNEALLYVGAPAGAGDDRERARQIGSNRGEGVGPCCDVGRKWRVFLWFIRSVLERIL